MCYKSWDLASNIHDMQLMSRNFKTSRAYILEPGWGVRTSLEQTGHEDKINDNDGKIPAVAVED